MSGTGPSLTAEEYEALGQACVATEDSHDRLLEMLSILNDSMDIIRCMATGDEIPDELLHRHSARVTRAATRKLDERARRRVIKSEESA